MSNLAFDLAKLLRFERNPETEHCEPKVAHVEPLRDIALKNFAENIFSTTLDYSTVPEELQPYLDRVLSINIPFVLAYPTILSPVYWNRRVQAHFHVNGGIQARREYTERLLQLLLETRVAQKSIPDPSRHLRQNSPLTQFLAVAGADVRVLRFRCLPAHVDLQTVMLKLPELHTFDASFENLQFDADRFVDVDARALCLDNAPASMQIERPYSGNPLKKERKQQAERLREQMRLGGWVDDDIAPRKSVLTPKIGARPVSDGKDKVPPVLKTRNIESACSHLPKASSVPYMRACPFPQPHASNATRAGANASDIVSLSQALARHPTLVQMTLRSSGVTAEMACALCAGIKKGAKLSLLDLGYNRIGDEGAKWCSKLLTRAHLRVLALRANAITADGAAHLAASFRHGAFLAALDISCNPLRSEGATLLLDAFAKMFTRTDLPDERFALSFCDCMLDDACGAALMRLINAVGARELSNPLFLDISGNGFSREKVKQFEEAAASRSLNLSIDARPEETPDASFQVQNFL